jgi:hypothetical protein
MTNFLLPLPDPVRYAERLILAKFDGMIPLSITTAECIELMLQFSQFESMRANEYQRLAEEMASSRPLPPIIIKR